MSLKEKIINNPVFQQVVRPYRIAQLRQEVAGLSTLNVVLGAGGSQHSEWLSTDIELLNIAMPTCWKRLFKLASIDRLLAEHVFEHLTAEECDIALNECFRYLKSGGLLRIAVPDGHRDDPIYLAEVSPPKDGHQVLFTVDTLVSKLECAGFEAVPLEYFGSDGQFHHHDWHTNDGFVRRSVRFDTQAPFKRGDLFYTSLIVDAYKP